MSVDCRAHPAPVDHFTHEAAFYQGLDGLVDRVVPFIREGVQREESVLVALIQPHLTAVRDALGADAADVEMVDMAQLGRNPARIIPEWRRFLGSARTPAVRGVGEPIWSGRRDVELEECRLHEALLNTAFDGGTPWHLLCPYDEAALPETVIDGAKRTHPELSGSTETRSPHFDDHYGPEAFTRPLTPRPDDAECWQFMHGDLPWLRALVTSLASRHRLDRDRIDDLVLATHELAANSIVHGGGQGLLTTWVEPDAFVVDVRDDGQITDPLVGREIVPVGADSGRGIWMAHQLCDLVQVRSNERGTTVRLYTWLD